MTIRELKGMNPTNWDIVYTDWNHKYFHNAINKPLRSVTQVLSSYAKPFDNLFWSKRKAKENGITQKQQLKIWEDKKDIGSIVGLMCHTMMENAADNKIFDDVNSSLLRGLDDNVVDSINERLSLLIPQINDLLVHLNYYKKYIPIGTELIVGNELFCGQCDLFAYNTETQRYVIGDWKTDAELTMDSKYRMIGNLSHVPSSKFHKYSLQLSCYTKLIADTLGISVEDIDRKVFWINENNESFTEIDIPYMENEINVILEDLKQNN